MPVTLTSLSLAIAPLERLLRGDDGPLPSPLASELRAITARLQQLARAATPAVSTLRREGDYWTLVHDGAVMRLRHAKGLAYLAQLLAQPEVELPALVLDRDGLDDGAGQPQLDHAAKLAYRERLIELRDEAAAALQRGDQLAADRREAEIDALTHELAAAVGLGGRDRAFASAAERARVNVTRNVRAAISRIAARHAALGRHLATGIRTGAFCRYAPDPGAAIRWLVAP